MSNKDVDCWLLFRAIGVIWLCAVLLGEGQSCEESRVILTLQDPILRQRQMRLPLLAASPSRMKTDRP